MESIIIKKLIRALCFAQRYGTDPNNEDSDGDTILDNVEITNGTNPNLSDTDSDGLDDLQEASYK